MQSELYIPSSITHFQHLLKTFPVVEFTPVSYEYFHPDRTWSEFLFTEDWFSMNVETVIQNSMYNIDCRVGFVLGNNGFKS